jgi:beta-barrel assembly-enhancing protease
MATKILFSHVFTVLIVMLLSNSIFSQSLFDNYSPLRAKGKIPAVFTESTQEKINRDKTEVDREKMDEDVEQQFLTHIHYNIDEMLNSGIILYGDNSTQYVNDVADKLLENNTKLKRKLQFYVIKSNVTNALSTDQGIIFVTLGLLSQLENEAQLAYVLSHEIAHYTESHVEKAYTDKYDINVGSSYDERIKKLSNYSRDNELEADRLGIDLYHKAGYAESELLSAFDVLTYSYLPFDEEPLPKTYFNSDLLFVPEYIFPDEINKIQVEEDYDDSKSSHPNIRRRKDQVIDELEKYANWGDKKFLLSQERFEEIRSIARFESVRIDLLDNQFGDALYSIFLLEQEFPNNEFLNKCKAQAWYGLALFKSEGEFSRTVQKTSSVEGESHAMHYALRKMTKIQLYTVATRNLVDIQKMFPESKELEILKKNMMLLLADYSKFSIFDYFDITYETALNEFEQSKLELAQDTLVESNELETDKELSKYDKIKNKRDDKVATSVDEEFEVKNFHLYALSDLVNDELFKRGLRMAKNEIEENEAEKERIRTMTRKERLKSDVDKVDISELILMDPLYTAYYYNTIDLDKTIEVEKDLITAFNKVAKEFGVELHDGTNSDKSKLNTDMYNQRAIILDYIRQRAEYEDMKMFPVDYEFLDDFKKNYGDSRVVLVLGDFVKTLATKKMTLTTLIVNIETGELEAFDFVNVKRKPRKVVLEYYFYDFFSRTGLKK